MVNCKFEEQVASDLVKTADTLAKSGDKERAGKTYAKAAQRYRKLAEQFPENRKQYEAYAAKYEKYAGNVPVFQPAQSNKATYAEPKKEEAPVEDETPATEEEREEALQAGLKELNSLIGLREVKEKISSLAKTQRINALMLKENLEPDISGQHLVFTGNPGTGKTTVARIIASIYFGLGILRRNHTEEVDRSNLVSDHIGGSEALANEILDKADGGVLFIDEVYALSQGGDNDFGHQVINRLLKVMEDKRNSFVMIVAGYTKEMEQFFQDNSGLRSRFKETINFEDYSDEDLVQIFKARCKKVGYVYDSDCLDWLKKIIQYERKHTIANQFGNARVIRNVYEKVVERQKNRIFDEYKNPTRDQLLMLKSSDFENVYNKMCKK